MVMPYLEVNYPFIGIYKIMKLCSELKARIEAIQWNGTGNGKVWVAVRTVAVGVEVVTHSLNAAATFSDVSRSMYNLCTVTRSN